MKSAWKELIFDGLFNYISNCIQLVKNHNHWQQTDSTRSP